jgi:DNA-binding CsgD family transcriptional regulator
MKPYSLYCITLLLLLKVAPLKSHSQTPLSGTPLITNYSPQEFKGGIQTWYFSQSEREILYMANNFGMLEFDGTTWEIHSLKNSTKVRSVLATPDGKIYAGSQRDFGYFESNNRGQLVYHCLADSLPLKYRNFDEVWRIYQKDGAIYFFTFKNIYTYTPNSSKGVGVIVPQAPLEYTFLVNNRILTLVWGQGLSELKGNQLSLLPGGEFFQETPLSAILPFDKNRLLIITYSSGLFVYDGHQSIPFLPDNNAFLSSSIINTALLLQDGRIALGTQNNGLYILQPNGALNLHISKEKGLIDRSVLSMFQDKHQNLWLGLNNGISMVELQSPFTTIDEKQGLPGAGYTALSTNEAMFLGTNNGIYSKKIRPEATYSEAFKVIENSDGQVYSLKLLRDQLLAGHHKGPMVIQDKKARLLASEKGAWTFLSIPNQPDMAISGTYSGISLFRFMEGEWKFQKHYEGFEESSRVLEFDDSGTLWMAHGYKGIYKISFQKDYTEIAEIKFYNSQNGFPSDLLINMERIGNRLVFPAEYGIFQYNPLTDSFQPDPLFSKIFNEDEHIIDMEEDVHGNIYFMSDQRIGILKFDALGQYTLHSDIFNKITRHLNDDLANITIFDARNILIGAKEGFIHYNPETVKPLIPFSTHIRHITNTSDGDSVLFHGGHGHPGGDVLPFKMNSLRIGFSATFFEDPKYTSYQWRLVKFDKDWSEWSATTEKEYTNLPEGKYIFQVRAKNIYGTISNIAEYPFTIRPPFYRSKVAYLLYTLGAIGLLGAAYFYLEKRYNQEKKMLLLKQERVLNQKDSEIKLITNKSEEEIMRLRNEKLQSEVEHKNRELISSTIHLVNKNELITSVKSSLEELVRKNYPEKGELKKIIHEVDQNLSSDKDWAQFEKHFNYVHGDFTHRLVEEFPQLSPQEIKLSAYLRLNLSTKEIAHLLNISVRGVEISRYRLRKKLGLDRNLNLTEFMLKF